MPKKIGWQSGKLWAEIKEVLDGQKFLIVYDLETTGLSSQNDRIIEIAAIRYRIGDDMRLIEDEVFQQYINPGYELPEKITEITGITTEFLADKPAEDEVFDDISAFFEDTVMSGYNIGPFDNKFMAELYARHGEVFSPRGVVDGIRMARDRIEKEEVGSYKLLTVGNFFGIEFTAHSAIEDTRTTGKLIQIFLDEYLESEKSPAEKTCGTERPEIESISFWEGFKGRNRIYVNTTGGTVYYDILEHRWGTKDAEIDLIDMDWLESSSWEFAEVASEPEFCKFKGNVRAKTAV